MLFSCDPLYTKIYIERETETTLFPQLDSKEAKETVFGHE